MSEINRPQSELEIQPRIVSELDMQLSPEQTSEVGEYFTDLLEEYGQHTNVPVRGKNPRTIASAEAVQAEFELGKYRFDVVKLDKGDEVRATLYQRRGFGKDREWKPVERFSFEPNMNRLAYKDFRDAPYYRQNGKAEGIIKHPMGKYGLRTATVNTEPPTHTELVVKLGNFLDRSERLIEDSKIDPSRARSLGKRILGRVISKQ